MLTCWHFLNHDLPLPLVAPNHRNDVIHHNRIVAM